MFPVALDSERMLPTPMLPRHLLGFPLCLAQVINALLTADLVPMAIIWTHPTIIEAIEGMLKFAGSNLKRVLKYKVMSVLLRDVSGQSTRSPKISQSYRS